ncbi:GIY-YIG nuclease family protein [Marivirga arenosa]|uniref:GIY-YIG nuclease family protein n=1 Tax=Marivirga arenosa TaxID=3059076 RepID=A0AA49JHZ0_9BACT|nr:GIY-YIG nuclease family protein [Marivirga sp. ABR2-2]WKK83991.2 GIY-YIG nuclease family protein [Marivirga sp. ABR2-2]
MFDVYVLYSPNHKKIYIGYTPDLKSRIDSHNIYSNKGYTKKYRPWVILYTEQFLSKSDALKREKQLKSAKGREFIWNLVKEKHKI